MKLGYSIVFKLVLMCMFLFYFQNVHSADSDDIKLLIRCDDIGMNHTVNMAADSLIKRGIPFSASVMFACPWYQEAVDVLKENPQISVGIHLTLNAEWKNYRWGPILGASAVPSLVDSNGYFFPSINQLFGNDPDDEEIEMELRAQIERAIHTGLKIDYIDHHMGTAVAKPEWREMVESLANEYQLGIATYFNEQGYAALYSVPVESKTDSLIRLAHKLTPGDVNLLVSHIGLETSEMNALIDMNDSFPLQRMSSHRHAEFRALMSDEFKQIVADRNIKYITYRDLIEAAGLKSMQRPEEDEY